MRLQSIVGCDLAQLHMLISKIERYLEENPWEERRSRSLTLEEQVQMVLTYFRQNHTQNVLAWIFGVSQSTVSRVVSHWTGVIDRALRGVHLGPRRAFAGQVVIVDGTYVPTGRRKNGRGNYSVLRHQECLNIQVACDIWGNLLAVSAPRPGKMHDLRALRKNKWEHHLRHSRWIADLGYLGSKALTGNKRHGGNELSAAEKAFNRSLSSMRIVIEHCNARLKQWKILRTGYRPPLTRLHLTLQAIVKLEILFRG